MHTRAEAASVAHKLVALHFAASSPVGSEQPAAPPPVDELGERAARVRAMLARWAAEPTTDEPDWSIVDIEPMHLEGEGSDQTGK